MTITENTAKIAGGKTIKKRYYDLITPKIQPEQETRNGQEIATNIIGRLSKRE